MRPSVKHCRLQRCKTKPSIFPSGKRSVKYSLPLRRVINLSVSSSRSKSLHWLADSDWYHSADGPDPVSSESIGGGGDIAMGVIETSLAAWQVGSGLLSNVAFISPVAGMILQALQMRSVRSDFSLYICLGCLKPCKIGSKAVQGRMGCRDGETHRHREHRHRRRRLMPGTRSC